MTASPSRHQQRTGTASYAKDIIPTPQERYLSDILLKRLNGLRILVVADPVRRIGIVYFLDEPIDLLVQLCTMADNVERRECEPLRTSEIMTKKLDDWM